MKKLVVDIDDNTAELLTARANEFSSTFERLVEAILIQSSRQQVSISKYKDECKCGGLEFAASEPSVPVEFNVRLNEYQIVNKTDESGSMTPLRYCFYCGGKAPKSRRGELFVSIPQAEIIRLTNLCKDIHTFDDAFRVFGAPNHDFPGGLVMQKQLDDNSGELKVYRSVVYTEMSKFANVSFTMQDDGHVSLSLNGKQIVADIDKI